MGAAKYWNDQLRVTPDKRGLKALAQLTAMKFSGDWYLISSTGEVKIG